MSSVKPLPKSIHSVMRSGVLFYDLTSVVEGLVFNSLDSGAKTVSIFIGIGDFSIKVVDDGSGISRDDLALLGERYAYVNPCKVVFLHDSSSKKYFTIHLDTCHEMLEQWTSTSKYQKTDMEDASPGIFGFRGEALASISDIAVLEIISKARGRPNGYRKVLKGCKCMYLGIDADQKDMGTTVIVRDLFYNQPIRQKSILSSPKKVLESVKRCVLLIAFVHPQISFKVVDIESDNHLLCTLYSSTPLPLVRSQYGSELCRSLYELNAQDGSLKLQGYLSGPNKGFAIKAFQLLYINSRPISKGPIHKLVNQIASMFDCMEIPTDSDGHRPGKRNRASSCVAFLLNLICPRSQYDLIFEPSNTYAEFKDWDPVLAFIEKTIKCCWKENLSEACNPRVDDVWKEDRNNISAMTVEEFQESPKFLKKKSKLANSHRFHDLPSSSDATSKECNWLSKRGLGEDRPKIVKNSIGDFYVSRDESGYLQCPFEFDCPIDKYRSSESLNCDAHSGYWWSPDNGSQSNHGSSYAYYNMVATDHTVNKNSSDEAVDCDAGYHWSPEYAMQPNHTKTYADGNLQEMILSSERTARSDLRGSLFGSTEENESLKFDSFVHNTFDMTLTSDHQQQRNNFAIRSGRWIPFKSCSLQGYTEESGFNIRSIGEYRWKTHGHKVRKKNISNDDGINFKEDDKSDWNFSSFSGLIWQDEACSTSAQPDKGMLLETDFLTAPLVTSLPSSTERLTDETCFTADSLPHRFPSCSFKWSADIDILNEPEEYGQICDDGGILESGTVFTRRDSSWHIYDGYHKYDHDIDANMPSKRKFISSFSKVGYNGENYASRFKHSRRQWIEEDFSLENSAKDTLSDDRMPSWDSHHRRRTSRENANSRDAFCSKSSGNVQIHQERPTRSLSAPPFYRKKTRLKFSNAFFTSPLKKFVAEAGKQNHSEKVFKRKHSSFGQGATGHLPTKFRVDATCKTEHDIDIVQISAGTSLTTSHESRDYGTKSRDSYVPRNSISVKSTHQSQILSTFSGILHLVSDFLVPKSITRDCLDSAQVLQQIDKKFITVVAGQTLAVIDQHAADERIRLEELRKKVLSGKVKKVTYLDSEKKLVLPEMAHQMLHNYKDQVESWGWICSIHTENSVSFRKNFTLINGWPNVVTLLAVPCILGVNLTDGDLLEFLQQLAETDGSSIMPPSVLRVLNFKACRGAIMFGDSLLPSECSLLVEELKKTKLCFQCAHGRPTTIPLVNLDELHKQVREFSMLDDRPNHPWHGLRRHEINLKRTTDRLHAALR